VKVKASGDNVRLAKLGDAELWAIIVQRYDNYPPAMVVVDADEMARLHKLLGEVLRETL